MVFCFARIRLLRNLIASSADLSQKLNRKKPAAAGFFCVNSKSCWIEKAQSFNLWDWAQIDKEESSWEEIFYPQGWNQQGRIIPRGKFWPVAMKSARENHPGKRFFIHRDEISKEESSLRENFHPQVKSARKNHPWERIFIRRDEISKEESSLGENFGR